MLNIRDITNIWISFYSLRIKRMDVLTRDTTFEIMKNMDDQTLLNFCKSNRKNAELCRNETFWQNRTIQKYPNYVRFKNSERKWKNFYMSLVYYLNLEYKKSFGHGPFLPESQADIMMESAAENGDEDFVRLAQHLNANRAIGIRLAILNGNLQILKELVKDQTFNSAVWYLFMEFAFKTPFENIKDFIMKESNERYGEHWTRQQKDILERLEMFKAYPYFH